MRIKNLITGLFAIFISIGGLCIIGIKEEPKLIAIYCHQKGGDDIDIDTCIESHSSLATTSNSQ